MTNIHSDLFETGGQDKIDIDEIGQLNGNGVHLLGDLLNSLKVQSGSNANGDWILYPDGTLECLFVTLNGFSNYTWVFPMEFETPPKVFALPTNNVAVSQVGGSKTTKQVTIQSTSSTYFNLMAKGKVKK